MSAMTTVEKNETTQNLSQQEMQDINGGFPLLIAASLLITFGVGMYVGYNEAAERNK